MWLGFQLLRSMKTWSDASYPGGPARDFGGLGPADRAGWGAVLLFPSLSLSSSCIMTSVVGLGPLSTSISLGLDLSPNLLLSILVTALLYLSNSEIFFIHWTFFVISETFILTP